MNIPFMTAQEAAAKINHRDFVGASGFTPSGSPKVIPSALAQRAASEHAAGNPFQVSLITGASTGPSCDGELSDADAIYFRTPYTTDGSFRAHANRNGLRYFDLNLSNTATQLRQGYLGQLHWAIIEVCHFERAGEKIRLYPTTGVGISPTIIRMAEKGILVEYNKFHGDTLVGFHDIYELEYHPHRTPVNITAATDRIGKPYIEVDAARVKGIVETNVPDEAREFAEPSDVTNQIGQNVADFLLKNLHEGLIPATFLNLQSGVGSGANAVLGALGRCEGIPKFSIYTEVLQNAPLELIKEGKILSGSTCSLSVTNDHLQDLYRNPKVFEGRVVLRPSEISNNPEVIARIGVCSMNTAIEADIYGHVNSTKICGTKMMNGIGGSSDFTSNSYLSIFTCGSTTKDGKISSIVPFCSHIDHTNHYVDAIITEYGVADLRGKCDIDKARELIKVAHPDYRSLLQSYLDLAAKGGGHTHHCLPAAFALHDTLRRKGDMRLTDFAEYIK